MAFEQSGALRTDPDPNPAHSLSSALEAVKGSFAGEVNEEIESLLSESSEIADALAHESDPEAIQELWLAGTSMAEGIAEARSRLLASSSGGGIEAHVLAGALAAFEDQSRQRLPLQEMAATSQEGIAALHERVSTKRRSYPYATLSRTLGKKVEGFVADAAKSVLERFAGRIPRDKAERVIALAGGLTGRLASLVIASGLAILAIGCDPGDQEGHDYDERDSHPGEAATESSADGIDIRTDPETEEIIIRKNGVGSVRISSLYHLENVVLSDDPNPLFDRIAALEANNSEGVNYEVSDQAAFGAAVTSDARDMAQRLFSKDLQDIVMPVEFIKLINSMVEDHLAYNSPSIQRGPDGKFTPEAAAEREKINAMPLDEMYLRYRQGVCRHYSALVELVGETLMASGAVPRIRGLVIDEVNQIEQMHAWNVYYLNTQNAGPEVAVGFTDATLDDDASERFGELDAKDEEHISVAYLVDPFNSPAEGGIGPELFTSGERERVFEKLFESNIGLAEER